MFKNMPIKVKLSLFIFMPLGYSLLLTAFHYFVKNQEVDILEMISIMIGIAIANFFIVSITPTEEEKAKQKDRTLKEYIQDFIISGSGFHKFVLAIYLFCILLLGVMIILYT